MVLLYALHIIAGVVGNVVADEEFEIAICFAPRSLGL